MSEADDTPCSHKGCDQSYATDVPAGWTVARVEEYYKDHVKSHYVYLCPKHKLVTAPKQASLFEDERTTP